MTTTFCGTRIEFWQSSTEKGSDSTALLIKAPATLELLGASSKLFKYHKLNSWTLRQPALSWLYKIPPYGYSSIPRHVIEVRCWRSQGRLIWNTEIILAAHKSAFCQRRVMSGLPKPEATLHSFTKSDIFIIQKVKRAKAHINQHCNNTRQQSLILWIWFIVSTNLRSLKWHSTIFTHMAFVKIVKI